MFSLVCLLEILLLGIQPDSSAISIHVVDKSDIVSSAHISVNNYAVGITDNCGNAIISGAQIGDEISVSHIAYETECFTVKTLNDTTVVLTPKYYSLPESVSSPDYDYDILKSKLKHGLSCGSLKEKIPVASVDSLISGDKLLVLEDNGYLSYLAKYKEPILSGYQARILDNVKSSKTNLAKEDIKKLKTHLSQALSNVGAYAEYACKCKKYKGFRVEYRGKNQDSEVFYFFIPPQDNGNAYKCRGFLYIDSNTGLLNHIEATCTSNNTDFASYDLIVDYQYLEVSNSILPKTIYNTTYYLDNNGSIFQTHRRRIVLDWGQINP